MYRCRQRNRRQPTIHCEGVQHEDDPCQPYFYKGPEQCPVEFSSKQMEFLFTTLYKYHEKKKENQDVAQRGGQVPHKNLRDDFQFPSLKHGDIDMEAIGFGGFAGVLTITKLKPTADDPPDMLENCKKMALKVIVGDIWTKPEVFGALTAENLESDTRICPFYKWHEPKEMQEQVFEMQEFPGSTPKKITFGPLRFQWMRSQANSTTLLDFLKSRTVPEYMEARSDYENVRSIFSDVMRAVLELHKKNLVHNDISLQNFLVYKDEEAWHAVLIDFDMARSREDSQIRGGTPAFIPPFHSSIQWANDTYALGIIAAFIVGFADFYPGRDCFFAYKDGKMEAYETVKSGRVAIMSALLLMRQTSPQDSETLQQHLELIVGALEAILANITQGKHPIENIAKIAYGVLAIWARFKHTATLELFGEKRLSHTSTFLELSELVSGDMDFDISGVSVEKAVSTPPIIEVTEDDIKKHLEKLKKLDEELEIKIQELDDAPVIYENTPPVVIQEVAYDPWDSASSAGGLSSMSEADFHARRRREIRPEILNAAHDSFTSSAEGSLVGGDGMTSGNNTFLTNVEIQEKIHDKFDGVSQTSSDGDKENWRKFQLSSDSQVLSDEVDLSSPKSSFHPRPRLPFASATLQPLHEEEPFPPPVSLGRIMSAVAYRQLESWERKEMLKEWITWSATDDNQNKTLWANAQSGVIYFTGRMRGSP